MAHRNANGVSRQWTDDERGKIAELWNQGQSAITIGAYFGCSRNSIVGIVNRMICNGDKRISRRPRGALATRAVPFSDRDSLSILNWREDFSLSWEEIGKRLSRSGPQCAQHYNEIIRDLNASERVG